MSTTTLSDLADFDMVPPKLVRRIWELVYIDMAELLPETWQVWRRSSWAVATQSAPDTS